MKPATNAPFYTCLYAALCDIARNHGYALAVHGTMTADCDVIAVPWTETASKPEVLYKEMLDRIGAVDYRGLIERDCDWASKEKVDDIVSTEYARIGEERGILGCTLKPHGRLAWNLYLDHGCKVDLSVMPLLVKCQPDFLAADVETN